MSNYREESWMINLPLFALATLLMQIHFRRIFCRVLPLNPGRAYGSSVGSTQS